MVRRDARRKESLLEEDLDRQTQLRAWHVFSKKTISYVRRQGATEGSQTTCRSEVDTGRDFMSYSTTHIRHCRPSAETMKFLYAPVHAVILPTSPKAELDARADFSPSLRRGVLMLTGRGRRRHQPRRIGHSRRCHWHRWRLGSGRKSCRQCSSCFERRPRNAEFRHR